MRTSRLALPLLFATGCGTSGDAPPAEAAAPTVAPTSDRSELRALILGSDGAEGPKAKDPSEVLPPAVGTDVRGGTLMTCTYHRYEGTQLYDSLVSFDPNADSLWPGSVVQSKALSEGLLAPVGLLRAKGVVTLSNALLGDKDPSYSREIDAPSQASVEKAVTDILRAKNVHLAAKADFLSEQVHSLSEAALKVGVSVDWMTGNVKGSFNGDWMKKRASFIVRFTQSYFTVSFNAPSSPEAFFAPAVTADDARPYMAKDNPPGYVASVTYGRMLFVKVESDDAESDVKAAIDAVFNAGAVSGQVDVDVHFRDIMGRATVTVFALGGSPSDAIEIMTSSADRAAKLKTYFDRGANYSADSPGVPIAYTVRRLKDNAAVKVASTLDYTVPDCAPQPSTVKIAIDGIQMLDNNTWIGGTTVSYKISINGSAALNGTRSGVGDTDFLSINEQRVLTVDKTNGRTVKISAEISQGDRAITPERTHTFYVDSTRKAGQWTQLGGNAVEQGNGGLKAQLKYSIAAD